MSCGTFKIRKVPALAMVDAVCSPMLWVNFRRTMIILPQYFSEKSSEEQLRQILSHELAHLVRYDHYSSWLAFCVTSLFWWNPIAWFARREMLMAMEACCDALAIERSSGSRQSYAETLLSAVDFTTQSSSVSTRLVAQFGESQSLKRRIEMIASSRVKSGLSGTSRLVVLFLGVMLLTLLPVQGEEPLPLPSTQKAAVQEVVKVDQDLELSTEKEKKEPQPGTKAYHEPGISNAKLVNWGVESFSQRLFFRYGGSSRILRRNN